MSDLYGVSADDTGDVDVEESEFNEPIIPADEDAPLLEDDEFSNEEDGEEEDDLNPLDHGFSEVGEEEDKESW